MSESDSDLDFESADEETEHESSEKSDVAKSSGNEKLGIIENVSNESNVTSNNTVEENLSSNISNLSTVSVEDSCDKSQVNRPTASTLAMPDSDKSMENTQSGKQRVTLRLQKKLAQKSQLSDESCSAGNTVTHDSIPANEKRSEVQFSSSWGFSSWGSSFLSTAASSVSTFTNQVSQGIGTVLESVENTLGAPPPEELAQNLNKSKEIDGCIGDNQTALCNPNEDIIESSVENVESKASLLPDVSSWTKVLENTGSKVIMGGLDTLELIGKKTIDILTEGDPGLRKKRAVFSDGVTLSKILKEAKAEADEQQENSSYDENTIHYSQMFDEYQGLVHLEALEMLSKQAQAKVQRLIICSKKAEMKKNIEEIKIICENMPTFDDPTDCERFQDFEAVFKKHALQLNLPFNTDHIIKVQTKINEEICRYENSEKHTGTAEEIYKSAICNLAEFTAKCIETFHKLAELILVQATLDPDAEQCATHLTGLTTVMCIEVNNLSLRYHSYLETLHESSKDELSSQLSNITVIVTNLYVEAANSNKYIQDAYLLLIPILQASLLEASE